VVLASQVRAEQPHGRDVESGPFEHLEDHRKTPRRSRHRDAAVGLLLGKGQRVPAVGEERAMAGAQVHVARIELREVGDEENGGATLAAGEVLDARHERGVGETPERSEKIDAHACLYHRALRARVRNVGRDPACVNSVSAGKGNAGSLRRTLPVDDR
jgi:hypothetical protein